MEKFKVTFEANDQQLKSLGTKHASDTYADIEATFILGNRWTDMDSVSAVWWNDFVRVATVLDSQGKCIVPHEVLTRKGCVRVNLVGSIVEGDELVTRLTSYSAEAVQVNEKIKLTGNETSEITPSQYEQFVANVKADADRAEAGADEAEQSAQSASESATASDNSASDSARSATASAQSAESASESAISAENAKDDAEDARDKILGMRATAETLEAGSDATVFYSDGLLTLGIPRGDKGERGIQGETGATPNFSIGEVDTLEPNESATATITGTAENPVLNLGIPKGEQGDVSKAQLDAAVTDVKSEIHDVTEPKKNIFNKDSVSSLNAYINGTAIASNANARTVYVPCEPNTTYTVSKTSITTRFAVAYTSAEPSVGGTCEGTIARNNSTSITITTNETATFLLAWIYLSSSDTLTFEQICAMLQIEKGSTASAYEAYALTAVDDYARDDLKSLHTYPSIQSDNTAVTYGDELITDFSALTPIGSASYANGRWTIPSGSGVSKTLSVTAWKTYVIDIGLVTSTITDGSSMYKVNPLTVTLGNATTNIFANTDGTWKVGLTPSASGTVTFSMICNDALELAISSLSIKQVTKFADIAVMINQNPVIISQFGTTKNIAVGNGQKTNATGDSNVAVGYNAQAYMATGNRNTAIGAYAQNKTKTGTANVAIGDNTQTEMESGMFNVAIGTATQRLLTYGSWNVGVGNEVQRNATTACNNVGIGRRAQSYITTGGMNTAVGAMAGFATEGHQTGDWATKGSNYQTLIGGESTQATTGTADYLSTLGYRAKGVEKAIAIGANSSAAGEKSIAIGYGASALNDNEVVIGLSGDSIILCGKRITFNSDRTVTWEDVT